MYIRWVSTYLIFLMERFIKKHLHSTEYSFTVYGRLTARSPDIIR